MDRRRREVTMLTDEGDFFVFRDSDEACPPSQNCINSEWGYSCECAPGFEPDVPMSIGISGDSSGDGSGDANQELTCIDIDECSPDLVSCNSKT